MRRRAKAGFLLVAAREWRWLLSVGEIRLESADRASGYFTTRADTDPNVNARTAACIGAPIQTT
jgi:hypothetical protein